MSEKKFRALRKMPQVKYDPGEDPINKRKYALVVCKKRIGEGRHITFARCGQMLICKGKRLMYHAAKKAYRHGWIKV